MDKTGDSITAEISAVALGRRLQRLLAQRGWKPANLAKEAGLAESWVPKLISGKVSKPHRQTLEKIAGAFDLTVEDLLTEAPTEELRLFLTSEEGDILRALAAIRRSPVEEIAATALISCLQREITPALDQVLQAVRTARQDATHNS